jgi:hypothetical protein
MRIWKNEQAKLKVSPSEVRLLYLTEGGTETAIPLAQYMTGQLHETIEGLFGEDILIESLAFAQQMIERS